MWSYQINWTSLVFFISVRLHLRQNLWFSCEKKNSPNSHFSVSKYFRFLTRFLSHIPPINVYKHTEKTFVLASYPVSAGSLQCLKASKARHHMRKFWQGGDVHKKSMTWDQFFSALTAVSFRPLEWTRSLYLHRISCSTGLLLSRTAWFQTSVHFPLSRVVV